MGSGRVVHRPGELTSGPDLVGEGLQVREDGPGHEHAVLAGPLLDVAGKQHLVEAVRRGLSGPGLLTAMVLASLPTAQNIFIHAVRYDTSVALARDAILLSTALSLPVILLAATLVRP